MSFGNTAPQIEDREQFVKSQNVVDTLSEFGFISSPQGVTPEDVVAILKRKEDIQKTSLGLSGKPAIALAFVDRMIAVQKELGNTEAVQKLVSNIDTDFVATLVKGDKAQDGEFLKTILTTGLNNWATGVYPTFSDALLDAVEKREHDLETTPTPSGMIDGQDNVVQPTDKIFH